MCLISAESLIHLRPQISPPLLPWKITNIAVGPWDIWIWFIWTKYHNSQIVFFVNFRPFDQCSSILQLITLQSVRLPTIILQLDHHSNSLFRSQPGHPPLRTQLHAGQGGRTLHTLRLAPLCSRYNRHANASAFQRSLAGESASQVECGPNYGTSECFILVWQIKFMYAMLQCMQIIAHTHTYIYI